MEDGAIQPVVSGPCQRPRDKGLQSPRLWPCSPASRTSGMRIPSATLLLALGLGLGNGSVPRRRCAASDVGEERKGRPDRQRPGIAHDALRSLRDGATPASRPSPAFYPKPVRRGKHARFPAALRPPVSVGLPGGGEVLSRAIQREGSLGLGSHRSREVRFTRPVAPAAAPPMS